MDSPNVQAYRESARSQYAVTGCRVCPRDLITVLLNQASSRRQTPLQPANLTMTRVERRTEGWLAFVILSDLSRHRSLALLAFQRVPWWEWYAHAPDGVAEGRRLPYRIRMQASTIPTLNSE
jgi:hypothetical protein